MGYLCYDFGCSILLLLLPLFIPPIVSLTLLFPIPKRSCKLQQGLVDSSVDKY